MKTKLLFLALFLVYFSSIAYSQHDKVIVGAGAGVALTNMRFNDSLDLYKPYIRPHFGVFSDFKLSKRIYLGTGLNMRSKGFRSDEIEFTDINGNTIRNGRYTYIFDYLTIPLIANYYFGDKVKFRIGVGGFYGLMLNATVNSPIVVEGQENPVDVTDLYSDNDIGVVARLGVLIPITQRLYFEFDIVDELGLSSIDNQNSNFGIYMTDLKTHSMSAGAGLAFTF